MRRRNRMLAGLDEEIREHIEEQTQINIDRGMSPEEARRAALIEFGNIALAKEDTRAVWTIAWLENLLLDLRYAARALCKSPGFTIVAILTLALGIGANTAVFSAYNALALKPLPVSDPGRVVRFERWFQSGTRGSVQYVFAYPEFTYVRDHQKDFSAVVAASWSVPIEGVLPGSGVPQKMIGQIVSANYFTAFGIRPPLGRAFAANEDQTLGGNAVIVISYPFWQRAFQGSPQAVGQVIVLNKVPFTIVGVAPKEFTGTSVFPQTPDFWAPLSMLALRRLAPNVDWLHQSNADFFQIFGRLKRSIARGSAQSEANLLIRQYSSTYVEADKTKAVTLQRTIYFPNADSIRFRAMVAGFMLFVGLILFVACVNVANMLLGRAAIRQHEISMRRTLGASRARIVRQVLTESVLLALGGAVAGVMLSVWTTQLLGAFLQHSAAMARISAINLAPDWRVLGYAFAVSIAAGTLLGLSPALHLVKPDLAAALKGETGSLGKISGLRVRSLLIGVQVTASVLLLAIAGLLTHGFIRAQAANPGFDIRDNFDLRQRLVGSGIKPGAVFATETMLAERLRSQPEFSSVALGSAPYRGRMWRPLIRVGRWQSRILGTYASGGYFKQLRIPLVLGRTFTPEESRNGTPVAVVSEAMARSFWPNRDPLGQTFSVDMNSHGKWKAFRIIGVVKDVRFADITRVDPPHAYLPIGPSGAGGFDILVRIRGNAREALKTASSLAAAIQKTAHPDLQLINFDQGLVAPELAVSRSLTMTASTLAVLAVLLAGVGIYGVLSYLVGLRTKEIGVRMALGARPVDVIRNVIVAGLRPVFGGLIAGMALAVALSALLHRALMDFLSGVPFYDPVTFGGLFCFVLVVVAIASAVPVHRATTVEPVTTLRHE